MSELIGSSSRGFVGGRFEKAPDVVGKDETSNYVVSEFAHRQIANADFGASDDLALPIGGEPVSDEAQPGGDEDDSVSLDEIGQALDGEDVVQDVAVSAAATGKGFDGPLLAELLEGSGPLEDVRLMMAIEVLRLGSKLTGDKMLAVLERLGFDTEVALARLTRDELSKIPDVPVESMTPLPGALDGGEGK
jgi:hypothetical protein